MSSDDVAFLNALAIDPADEAPWLIYADWLEENDPRRGEYVRLLVGLISPTFSLPMIDEYRTKLAVLRPEMPDEWRERLVELRGLAPLRCKVERVFRIGNIPPREMFDRAMSFLEVSLLSGTVKFGDPIKITYPGITLEERVMGIESFAMTHEVLRFNDTLPQFALAWSGHRIAKSGVREGATITPRRVVS